MCNERLQRVQVDNSTSNFPDDILLSNSDNESMKSNFMRPALKSAGIHLVNEKRIQKQQLLTIY